MSHIMDEQKDTWERRHALLGYPPDEAFIVTDIAQDERDAERFAAGWAAGRQFDVRALMHPHVEPDEIDEDPSE